jgi:hypothetical protein
VNTAWRNFAARPPAPRRDPLPRKRDLNAEARIQAAIVEYVSYVAPQIIIWAVPNGGLRSKSEAARLKWTGVLAGVFDLTLVLPNGRCAFWEVKTPDGYLSSDQLLFANRLISAGHSWAIIRSIEDARQELDALGVKTKEAPR